MVNIFRSEHPASVFSILESGNKTVTLTSDTLFDLLMLKLTNVYKKKQTIESRGPRFEIGDFIVKLGSVTVGSVFKVNKTKYFRLRLDEVSSERPKRDLGETWVWPGTDLRLT